MKKATPKNKTEKVSPPPKAALRKTPVRPKTAAKATGEGEKLDLIKLHKASYVTPSKPVLIEPKRAKYLVVEGKGAPGGPEFEARVGALYSMAFTIKMSRKFAGLGDYAVSKLECIYPGLGAGKLPAKEQWRWKLMILTPDFIEQADLTAAVALLRKKGKEGDAAFVSIEALHEGPCVQMLHVGPYDKECETLGEMEAFAKTKGLRFSGDCHEIYISDPRRVEPDKLKTILRHPVAAL